MHSEYIKTICVLIWIIDKSMIILRVLFYYTIVFAKNKHPSEKSCKNAFCTFSLRYKKAHWRVVTHVFVFFFEFCQCLREK